MGVHTIHEPKLLGTAGTLLANQAFFSGATGLLIHADNAIARDLQGLLAAHADRPAHCLLTMLTFRTDQPGRPVDLRDTLIAGIALAHQAQLGTRNSRHFSDTTISLINPFTPMV